MKKMKDKKNKLESKNNPKKVSKIDKANTTKKPEIIKTSNIDPNINVVKKAGKTVSTAWKNSSPSAKSLTLAGLSFALIASAALTTTFVVLGISSKGGSVLINGSKPDGTIPDNSPERLKNKIDRAKEKATLKMFQILTSKVDYDDTIKNEFEIASRDIENEKKKIRESNTADWESKWRRTLAEKGFYGEISQMENQYAIAKVAGKLESLSKPKLAINNHISTKPASEISDQDKAFSYEISANQFSTIRRNSFNTDVTEQQYTNFYRKIIDFWIKDVKPVAMQHILIKTKDKDATLGELKFEKKSLFKLYKIMTEHITANPADPTNGGNLFDNFENVARLYSEDGSKANGGRLGITSFKEMGYTNSFTFGSQILFHQDVIENPAPTNDLVDQNSFKTDKFMDALNESTGNRFAADGSTKEEIFDNLAETEINEINDKLRARGKNLADQPFPNFAQDRKLLYQWTEKSDATKKISALFSKDGLHFIKIPSLNEGTTNDPEETNDKIFGFGRKLLRNYLYEKHQNKVVLDFGKSFDDYVKSNFKDIAFILLGNSTYRDKDGKDQPIIEGTQAEKDEVKERFKLEKDSAQLIKINSTHKRLTSFLKIRQRPDATTNFQFPYNQNILDNYVTQFKDLKQNLLTDKNIYQVQDNIVIKSLFDEIETKSTNNLNNVYLIKNLRRNHD